MVGVSGVSRTSSAGCAAGSCSGAAAHLHGLGVGGVVAAGARDERVLTGRRGREELLAGAAAHRAADRADDPVVQARAARRCAGRRPRWSSYARLQALVVEVEGVAVLHEELAAAQDARAGPRLVAVLRLHLVQHDRQVLVRRALALHQRGEQLLVGRREQVLAALAVLEPEQQVAVLGPAPGRLVVLLGQQRGEQHLLPAHPVHLLAHDAGDPVEHLAGRAAARCRCRARPGARSRRGPAAGGSGPPRPPGPHAGCAGTGWTCGARASPRERRAVRRAY